MDPVLTVAWMMQVKTGFPHVDSYNDIAKNEPLGQGLSETRVAQVSAMRTMQERTMLSLWQTRLHLMRLSGKMRRDVSASFSPKQDVNLLLLKIEVSDTAFCSETVGDFVED